MISRGVAHRAVGADLRLVVAAGILAVVDVDDVIAVAVDVVGHADARHDAVGVDADDRAGRRRFTCSKRAPMSAESRSLIVQ